MNDIKFNKSSAKTPLCLHRTTKEASMKLRQNISVMFAILGKKIET